jgi:hypothetical protein
MKKLIIVWSMLLCLLTLITSAYAFTTTLNLPSSNQNVTADTTYNCSITGGVNVDNASIQYYSSGWNTIVTNSTAGTEWVGTLQVSAVSDGTYTMRCLAEPGGDNETASANVTLVTFDDTAPTGVSFTLSDNYVSSGSTQTLTISCTEASVYGCYYCEIEDNIDYPSSYGNDTAPVGSFSWTPKSGYIHKTRVRCADYFGHISSWTSWQEWQAGSPGKKRTEPTQVITPTSPSQQQSTNTLIYIAAAVVIYLVFFRKK